MEQVHTVGALVLVSVVSLASRTDFPDEKGFMTQPISNPIPNIRMAVITSDLLIFIFFMHQKIYQDIFLYLN
jgi:hypothetical protein